MVDDHTKLKEMHKTNNQNYSKILGVLILILQMLTNNNNNPQSQTNQQNPSTQLNEIRRQTYAAGVTIRRIQSIKFDRIDQQQRKLQLEKSLVLTKFLSDQDVNSII